MGLRERLTAADRLATVVSSVSVASPDHPNRGGLTGDGPGTDPPEHDHGDGDGGGDGESPDPTGDTR